MENYYPILISLLSPLSLIIYAGVCLLKPFKNSRSFPKSASYVGLFGILISLISVISVLNNGTIHSTIVGLEGLGFSIRIDNLSVSMLSMISILGFVILRFSTNYMDGDSRKSIFFSRLAFTISAVEVLILSGNLFQIFTLWIITSICLHYLLVFYRSRPQAIAAARKKFILARASDLSLLIAIAFIYSELGTGDLEQIFASLKIQPVLSTGLVGATIALVLAAVLKSAQFPTHGWLIEVVETPTPVSALLHAGLLNAGPFLMVRLSFLMAESTPGSLMLIIIGGFTAMFASIVYLTQSSIKVSLGYSSIAHMGFSLLLCGLGLYSAAMLHVVAHSFYKAHSFLSSGSVVDLNKVKKIGISQGKRNVSRVGVSIAFALGIYAVFCYLIGINPSEEFNLISVGFIIVMGISQMMSATLSGKASIRTITSSVGIALLVVASFFTLEHGAHLLLGNQVPSSVELTPTIQWAIVSIVCFYAIVTLIQLLSFKFENTEIGYKIGVYLRNGFYANVVFDRVIGSLKSEKFKWVNLTIQEDNIIEDKLPTNKTVLPNKKVLLSNSN